MKRTAEILKAAREKKGVTINEVALVTKINAKTLEALESGEIERLPQKAFVRGFVQTYAKYLGLNPTELLNLFQEEMGQTRPDLPTGENLSKAAPPQQGMRKLEAIDDRDPTSKSRRWMMGIAGVILIIAIFTVAELVRKYERESEAPPVPVETVPISAESSTDAPLPSSTDDTSVANAVVAAMTSTTTPTTTMTVMTSTTAVIVTSTTTHTSTTHTSTTRTSTTRTTTTAKPTTTTAAKSTTTITKSSVTTTTLVKARTMELILEALDSVTIEFRIDGGGLQTVKLAPDQVQTFKAKQSIAMDVSDGGAVNVIYNGLDKGVPGSLGKPAKIKYP